nr:MAG TPA: hypothetical protein [Bacteriophage sp.]
MTIHKFLRLSITIIYVFNMMTKKFIIFNIISMTIIL